jgi:hypothetical protein
VAQGHTVDRVRNACVRLRRQGLESVHVVDLRLSNRFTCQQPHVSSRAHAETARFEVSVVRAFSMTNSTALSQEQHRLPTPETPAAPHRLAVIAFANVLMPKPGEGGRDRGRRAALPLD